MSKKKSEKGYFWMIPVILILCFGLMIFINKKGTDIQTQKASQIDISNQPVIGDKKAPVTIVEFGDYKCPACKQFNDESFPKLKSDYINTGKVKLVFMDFPFLGPDATTAAIASKNMLHMYPESFWNFHEAIYKFQQKETTAWATSETLTSIAKKIGVKNFDETAFKKAIDDKTYESEVNKDYALGKQLGVPGTPAVFVNGVLVEKAYDYSTLKKQIDKFLKEAKTP
jgi:protein-disulfide isomerase